MTELELRKKIEQKLPFLSEGKLQKLHDLIDTFLEKEEETSPQSKPKRQFGFRKGALKYMAPDFNEPLDEFKDYMPE